MGWGVVSGGLDGCSIRPRVVPVRQRVEGGLVSPWCQFLQPVPLLAQDSERRKLKLLDQMREAIRTRRSFATQLFEAERDIRTIQELLGHRDASATMIYTHVLNRGGKGAQSPADRL